AIPDTARQSETHRKSNHGRRGRTGLRYGIMGNGSLCYRFQLVTFVVARFAFELRGTNPSQQRRGFKTGLRHGAIFAALPQVSASKFRPVRGQGTHGVPALPPHRSGSKEAGRRGANKTTEERRLKD